MEENRVGIVTGGASGIGLACAEKLTEKGVKIVIADLNFEQGNQVAQKLGGYCIEADLSKQEDCQKLINETVNKYGRIDILINNAGFQHIDKIENFPEETWDKMIALMMTAPFLLIKYAWQYLIKSGQGRIVNMGSVHSLTASPFKIAYVTAKHGIIGLTKVVALEGGEYGLTCNTICPAYVRTPLVEKQILAQSQTRGIPPEEVETKILLEKAVIKKLLEPEDVANYVTYLCSAEAWGITGSIQPMDLGWCAH